MVSASSRLLLFAVGIVLLTSGSITTRGGAESANWLDRPIQNWNTPGAALPKAPPHTIADTTCKGLLRTPAGPEDRALIAAGWDLIGPLQTYSGTTIVTGESGEDGMCRPMGYQVFVFVGGKFAGTISPALMNSREDGSAQPNELFSAGQFAVTFSRYKKTDPACCPSGTSTVTYRVQTSGGAPVVMPTRSDYNPTK
jgi:LppP/LprE lipoprotein